MYRRERYEEQGWESSNVLDRGDLRLELEYWIARYLCCSFLELLHKDDDPAYGNSLAANHSMSWWKARDIITIRSVSP